MVQCYAVKAAASQTVTEIIDVEFIEYDEATSALESVDIVASFRDEEHLQLEPDPDDPPGEVSFLHLSDENSSIEPREGARVVTVPKDQLADSVEAMIGLLHLSQVLVLPVGKWRSVFDAVAFSMASNEDWQEVDAEATVRLNKRDPLLFDPGDYHTLHALIDAVFSDAETPDQGIIITTTASPFFAEIIPAGAVRVMVGNQVLADEIVDGLHLSAE